MPTDQFKEKVILCDKPLEPFLFDEIFMYLKNNYCYLANKELILKALLKDFGILDSIEINSLRVF